jgi:hypothetical protein
MCFNLFAKKKVFKSFFANVGSWADCENGLAYSGVAAVEN